MLIGIYCICFRVAGKHDDMSVSKCGNLFPHLLYMLALDSHWLSSEPYHFRAGLQCRNDTWPIGCKDMGTRLLHLLLMRSSIQALIAHVDTRFSLTNHGGGFIFFFVFFVLGSTTLSCKGTWWHAPLFFLRVRSSLCRLILVGTQPRDVIDSGSTPLEIPQVLVRYLRNHFVKNFFLLARDNARVRAACLSSGTGQRISGFLTLKLIHALVMPIARTLVTCNYVPSDHNRLLPSATSRRKYLIKPGSLLMFQPM